MTPIEAIVDAFGYPALVYMAVCVGLWLLLWGWVALVERITGADND